MRLLIRALAVCFALVLLSACSRTLDERLPAVGQVVPTFDLPRVDGSRVTSASLTGRPTLLALWSTDCGASMASLKALAGIEVDYAARGVRVLILADDDDPQRVRAAMEKAKVAVPVAYASGRLGDIFDPGRRFFQHTFALPSFLLLDSNGRVATVTYGIPEAEFTSRNVRLQHVRDAVEAVLKQRRSADR